MKIKNLLLPLLAVLVLVGCKGGPPSRFESFIYDIKTNYVPTVFMVTNTVAYTNTVPILVERKVYVVITNEVGVPSVATNFVWHTNFSTEVEFDTQIITRTNMQEFHDYVVKASTTDTVQTVGSVINTFVPGVGGLISTALVGAIGIFARWKSRKANEALIQGVETGREIINAITNDPTVDQRFKDWLIEHQKEKDVFNLISGLVDKYKDKPAAEVAARGILATPPVITRAPLHRPI